ncbi:putative bifunctional diguanylate cyclase/phosphodiesterase [Crenobacter intestini]|uniref:putative bifunctional diguanylate cyclase/phosphodiesterase n=1 Tax=Crenobacter intestini TaxID=2563443 RepID=UPI001458E155|nr:EAL domain-containing protein [Crenobacter intestini]
MSGARVLPGTGVPLGRLRARLSACLRVQQAAGVGGWEVDLERRRVRADAQCWRMFGYAAYAFELDADDALARVHPEDIGLLGAEAAEQLRLSGRFETEFRVRHRDGQWLWLVARGSVGARAADGTPVLLVGALADITERKRSEQRASRLAYYDALTGLPNRRLLLDRLALAQAGFQRNRRLGALIYIDLDYFKQLNDTLGHDAGDQVLCETGRRLIDCVRTADTVARIGGDEFVVMVEALAPDAHGAGLQAEAVARKILAGLCRPFELSGHAHLLGGSLGVALFGGDETVPESLLQRADLAMYHAKRAGRHAIRFFDPQMQAEVEARARLAAALADAMEDGALQLHVQRQFDAAGKVTGAEALLRWQHPEHGWLRGREIMALVQESALASRLGRWVLEAACAELSRWQRDAVRRQWTLAVNLSEAQLYHPDYPGELAAVLARHEVPPARLQLEIGEPLLARRPEAVGERLCALAKVGVGLVLDDFGSGLTALFSLRHQPFVAFKVDCRVLFEAMDGESAPTLCRAFLSLAESMRVEMVARGVETAAQHALLSRAGCRRFQGELFAPVEPSRS